MWISTIVIVIVIPIHSLTTPNTALSFLEEEQTTTRNMRKEPKQQKKQKKKSKVLFLNTTTKNLLYFHPIPHLLLSQQKKPTHTHTILDTSYTKGPAQSHRGSHPRRPPVPGLSLPEARDHR